SHLEIIDQFGLNSLRIKILGKTDQISGMLVVNRHDRALALLASFWKRIADKYMVGHPQVFTTVIKCFRNATESLAKNDVQGEAVNGMFRDIGWLGEKLFLKESIIEEEPLMPDDHEQSNLFDDLMNMILGLEDIYTKLHPEWYPLVYFDAVDVVFIRLVEAVQAKKFKLKNENTSIFNLLWIYSSFAEAALLAGNSDGAALAAIRIKESIKKLHDTGL